MMSPRSTKLGLREYDSRKRAGSVGWRRLTCPYASTAPNRARTRFAMTRSISATSNAAMLGHYSLRFLGLLHGLIPGLNLLQHQGAGCLEVGRRRGFYRDV